MREVIATGKTVEEATENGCRELGLDRHEVSVEILEMPQKKLFKSTPAKVRVTADTGEEPAEAAPAPAPAQAPAAPAAPPSAAAAAAPVPQTPAKKLLPQEPEEVIVLEENPRAQAAARYLLSVLKAMDAGEVSLSALRQGDATLLRVEGEGIAQKMEVRGEVIQALSYLIDRAVNAGVDKKDPDYLRIRLDVAGYRNRRESELIALAQRTGSEVARTRRSRTLAPMNPYERLIVHTAISKMEGVVSESIGTDVERRVVVKSTAPDATDGEDWRPPRRSGGGRGRGPGRDRRDDRGPRGGGERGGRGGPRGTDRERGGRGGYGQGGGRGGFGEKRTNTPEREYADKPRDPNAAPIVPQRRDAIKDGEDLPLYGKIEL